MKKLAVKFYRDTLNPHNIPGDWPSLSYQFDDEKHTPDPSYTVMTEKEYKDYIKLHQAEYDHWKKSLNADVKIDRKKHLEYPSREKTIDALIAWAKLEYSKDQSRIPQELINILNERAAVDNKYD